MLGFIQTVAAALRDLTPPDWHAYIETCLFRTLLNNKDRLNQASLDLLFQLCHHKENPGLDSERWTRLCQKLLHPEHRVRVAHALNLHLHARLPGFAQHLHLLPLTELSEEISGWIFSAMERFPCIEHIELPQPAADEPEGDPTLCALARMAIAAIEGANQLVDRLPNDLNLDRPQGKPATTPQHDAVNDVTTLAQTAESIARANGIDLSGMLRLLLEKK